MSFYELLATATNSQGRRVGFQFFPIDICCVFPEPASSLRPGMDTGDPLEVPFTHHPLGRCPSWT